MRSDMCHHGKRTHCLALMVVKVGMNLASNAIHAYSCRGSAGFTCCLSCM